MFFYPQAILNESLNELYNGSGGFGPYIFSGGGYRSDRLFQLPGNQTCPELSQSILVGGFKFQPIWIYISQIGSFLQVGVKMKKNETTT